VPLSTVIATDETEMFPLESHAFTITVCLPGLMFNVVFKLAVCTL
jgi:hypothetical protein